MKEGVIQNTPLRGLHWPLNLSRGRRQPKAEGQIEGPMQSSEWCILYDARLKEWKISNLLFLCNCVYLGKIFFHKRWEIGTQCVPRDAFSNTPLFVKIVCI